MSIKEIYSVKVKNFNNSQNELDKFIHKFKQIEIDLGALKIGFGFKNPDYGEKGEHNKPENFGVFVKPLGDKGIVIKPEKLDNLIKSLIILKDVFESNDFEEFDKRVKEIMLANKI